MHHWCPAPAQRNLDLFIYLDYVMRVNKFSLYKSILHHVAFSNINRNVYYRSTKEQIHLREIIKYIKGLTFTTVSTVKTEMISIHPKQACSSIKFLKSGDGESVFICSD